MSDFTQFIPLYKVQEQSDGSCLVYARGTQEVPDAAGQIMDYASTVPHIKAWSEETFARSNGQSYGNIRAMHGKQASGKVNEPISYKDDEKAVDMVVKVVDPVDVKKCKEGVYTGLSIGGEYVGRPWRDPSNPRFERYTGKPIEFSLVDLPSVPTATFQMVKADGTTELCKFSVGEQWTDEALVEGGQEVAPVVEAISTGEQQPVTMPIVADTPIVPPMPAPEELSVSPQQVEKTIGEMMARLDRLTEMVEKAEAMQKEKSAQEENLQKVGSRVGIARRDGEPIVQPSGYPTSADEYADPANWSWPCDSQARCQSALAYFNGGTGKEKYSSREWNVLGRRIAQRASTQLGAKYQYKPATATIERNETMKKDALSDVVGNLRSAAQSALDNVSNPEAVMSALHQIIAAIDVASDVSGVSGDTPSSGAETLGAAVAPQTTPTTATSTSTETAMAKMAEQIAVLANAVEKLNAKPTDPAPVEKGITIGDLNARVQLDAQNAAPLEKALLAVSQSASEGIKEDQIAEIMKAAGGNAQLAQDRATELVRLSLYKRGINSQTFTRVIDPMMAAALIAQAKQ